MTINLLPTLDLTKSCEVNLDDAAVAWFARQSGLSDSNHLLSPDKTQEMIDWLHNCRGVSWSFGSYLEDRSHLLRGCYLDQTGGYVHLGVDVNVPAGTPVAAPYDCTVINVFDDGNTPQGWGPRVILKPADDSLPYLVLGHLTPDCATHKDTALRQGEHVAEVAAPPFNGDWFPHLHIQQIARFALAQFEADQFSSLDGYGHPSELENLRRVYPDPRWLIVGGHARP